MSRTVALHCLGKLVSASSWKHGVQSGIELGSNSAAGTSLLFCCKLLNPRSLSFLIYKMRIITPFFFYRVAVRIRKSKYIAPDSEEMLNKEKIIIWCLSAWNDGKEDVSVGSDSVWLEKEQFCISNNTVIFKEHALKMSENLCSTKHTIGKLKDKPQTGRKYLHIIFLIKDCFQNISRTSTTQQGDKISVK